MEEMLIESADVLNKVGRETELICKNVLKAWKKSAEISQKQHKVLPFGNIS